MPPRIRMEPFDIVGSYDNERISSLSAQRTVNMFEYIDPKAGKQKVLFSTAGLVNTGLNFYPETLGARASMVFNNIIYQVFGASFFQITGSLGELASSKLGNLITSLGYVRIVGNDSQLLIVDGQKGYIWDAVYQTFTQITDTSFPAKPIDADYLDGFFVVINGDTNGFQLSSLQQGLVWGAAQDTFTADSSGPSTNWLTLASTDNFQTGVSFTVSTTGTLPSPLMAGSTDIYYAIRVDATHIRVAASYEDAMNNIPITLLTNGTPTNTITSEGQLQEGFVTSHPGTLVAVRTLHRKLFLFSQNYIEVWENAGIGTNLPFRRNNGLLLEIGTPALGSIVVGFDRMFFLSQDKDGLGSIIEVQGTQPVPVSTRALDYQLNQYAADQTLGVSHISDARGILIKENGLIFYRLNFTRSNHTFVLNVSMSSSNDVKWHEEEVLNGDRHPAQTHVYYNGINYYGAYDSATLYRVDTTVSTNDGEAIRRMRIGKEIIPPGFDRTRIDRFHLDVLQGAPVTPQALYYYMETESRLPILTEQGELILLEQFDQTPIDFPNILFSYSKDGGQTFGYFLEGAMGRIGERTFRTIWRKLGVTPEGHGLLPRVEFFYDTPFVILGAAWGFEVLPE